jgi:hypothetical protein
MGCASGVGQLRLAVRTSDGRPACFVPRPCGPRGTTASTWVSWYHAAHVGQAAICRTPAGNAGSPANAGRLGNDVRRREDVGLEIAVMKHSNALHLSRVGLAAVAAEAATHLGTVKQDKRHEGGPIETAGTTFNELGRTVRGCIAPHRSAQFVLRLASRCLLR